MIASRRVRTAALFTGLLMLMAGLSACDETAITPPLPTPGGAAEATVTAPVTPSPTVTRIAHPHALRDGGRRHHAAPVDAR